MRTTPAGPAGRAQLAGRRGCPSARGAGEGQLHLHLKPELIHQTQKVIGSEPKHIERQCSDPPARTVPGLHIRRSHGRARTSRSLGHPSSAANQGICISATCLCITIAILISPFLVACGAPSTHNVRNGDAAKAVRGLPTFPGATWEGDVTSQEADGQLIWVVSWTARSAESRVRHFYASTLGQSGWQFGAGKSSELALWHDDPKLRGYLRFRKRGAGLAGTDVTLGIRDPRPRPSGCLKALPWLPIYPGAQVRGCDLVHIPGSQSLSVLFATGDDFEVSQQTLSHAFQSAGWTRQPGILDLLVFSHTGLSNTARVIWGPDPDGLLSTGFMLSIDLRDGALSELPQ